MTETTHTRFTSGYSTWRLIAEELRAEIMERRLREGDRLPSEKVLAERFGVNRHTARQAIASLADEGFVEARRGSGTFVTGETVHLHRVSVRTRNSLNSDPRMLASSLHVLYSANEVAPPEVREKLQLDHDDVVHVETLQVTAERPIAMGTHWFDAKRFPDIADELRRTGSVTAALRNLGVEDYVRTSTVVGARLATNPEQTHMKLAPGAVVLLTRSLDSFTDGTPLQRVIGRFSAQHVMLDIEHPMA